MRPRPLIPFAVALLAAGLAAPAEAHHAMGGAVPATLAQGLLSGVAHPVIGLDHLAFLVAAGLAIAALRLPAAIAALLVGGSIAGVLLHVAGLALPATEGLVALSVVAAGVLLLLRGSAPTRAWAALLSAGGVLHGMAFGEAVVGSEPTPLVAYLLGLALVPVALLTGVAHAARPFGLAQRGLPRLAAIAISAMGVISFTI